MILPHGREIIEILPLSDLYTEFKDHERLTVFANKGLRCVTCPRTGTFLILSRETNLYKSSRKRSSIGRVHIDIYTDDFILMTVDHIIAKYICKQLGWTVGQTESLDNKQPMCEPCNGSKGHKLLSNEELARNRQNAYNGLIQGARVIHELIPNIHRMVGDEQWFTHVASQQ